MRKLFIWWMAAFLAIPFFPVKPIQASDLMSLPPDFSFFNSPQAKLSHNNGRLILRLYNFKKKRMETMGTFPILRTKEFLPCEHYPAACLMYDEQVQSGKNERDAYSDVLDKILSTKTK